MWVIEKGDFLLVDNTGTIQAVSGNSEFFDIPEAAPDIPSGSYTIVEVESSSILHYIKEKCDGCKTKNPTDAWCKDCRTNQGGA